MPKYLIEASYRPGASRALHSAGGSRRRDAVARLAESAGGKLESFHFAFGDSDAYVIAIAGQRGGRGGRDDGQRRPAPSRRRPSC